MQLSLLTFTSAVQQQAAAAQAKCAQLVNFTTGSVVRAILEANAGLSLWFQWLVLQVLGATRLTTSAGADVDTFVGDFGLTRLPAVAATGTVIFGRFTSINSAVVPVGANVMTADGRLFVVIADAANTAYSAAANGYPMAINVASVSATVRAVVGGSAGNVLVGAIALPATAISGVDTVTNPVAFSNGVDAETDDAIKARFPLYIQGLSKATSAAIASAVLSVQQNLAYAVAVNQDTAGGYRPGNFVVTVDDGSGAPSAALQAAVYAAVDNVRSLCETFSVQGPTVTTINVNATITTAPGVLHATVAAGAAYAVAAYINAVPIGGTVSYLRVAQVIFDSAPAGQVTNVAGLTLNSGSADIVVSPSGAPMPGTIVVT